jgi:hypothetical protein
MSAIASFYLFDTDKLDALVQNAEIIEKKILFSKKVTDNFWDYLAGNATELPDLDGSGYIYGNLFVYLEEEKNIDLLSGPYEHIVNTISEKRNSTIFIFTKKQQELYLDQLNPDLFSVQELQRFNEEFSEEGDEETARLSLDAIRILWNNLARVQNEDQVLLLLVG